MKIFWISLLCALGFSSYAQAADLPTFRLEMQDGRYQPARLEVPAGQRIKIEIYNVGKTPAEFVRRRQSEWGGALPSLRRLDADSLQQLPNQRARTG